MGGQDVFVQVYHLFATDATPILHQAFIPLALDDLLGNQMLLPIHVIIPDLIVREEHFLLDGLKFKTNVSGEKRNTF